jgi:gliding motility-associated-like protein
LKLHIKYIVFVLLLTLSSITLFAQQIRFIENAGQWEREVLFKANIPGGDLYITSKGLVYNFFDEHALHEKFHDHIEINSVLAHAIFLDLVDVNKSIKAVGYDKYNTIYNYFSGSDQSKWRGNVNAYNRVVLQNVYPNIDFEIVGLDGGVKTSFIVKRGGNRNRIKWKYNGADQVSLQHNQITVTHGLGQMVELVPVSYIINNGSIQQLSTNYVLDNNNQLSYEVLMPMTKNVITYDSLIIDPNIVFSSLSGSVADNFGFTSTFDNIENAYGGGTVYAVGFPVTPGAYQLTFSGGFGAGTDVGIHKFNPDGTQLLYATYLGGIGNEQPHSMTCDANGNLYVMGSTNSNNFPVKNGFDMSHNGGFDIFVACLSANGSTLISSTYLGGRQHDGLNGGIQNTYSPLTPTNLNYGDSYRGDIRLDNTGDVYIASVTQSSSVADSLPLANATQPVFGGGRQDGWVIKMNGALNTLLFSTYLGGIGVDAAYSIQIQNGSFFVAGGTNSPNFPVTHGNLAPFAYNGDVDGFVTRFNETPNTFSIQKSVYLGSAGYDQAYFVSADKYGKIYATGQTASGFPKIGNVFHEPNGKLFITVLNPDLTSISLQSSFGVGSKVNLSPSAFMVDLCDNIYFSGWGGDANKNYSSRVESISNLLTTSDAFQRTTDGSDFYLIIFAPNISEIHYATYFGGSSSKEHVDGGTSHFSPSGVVYQSVCAGCGGFSDFPTTEGAYSRINNAKRPNNPFEGGCNNGVFKFNVKPNPVVPIMKDTLLEVTLTDTINYNFTITDANGDSIVITSINGELLNLTDNPAKIEVVSNKAGLIRLNLFWAPHCKSPVDTFYFFVNFYNISCNSRIDRHGLITLIVKNIPVEGADMFCVKQIADNVVDVSWEPIVQERYINRINIYRKKNNESMDSLIAIKPPILSSQYIDIVEESHLNNYCYRILSVNNCEVTSEYSRQSCLLEGDKISVGEYTFSRDSVFHVRVPDTLNAELLITDNVFKDSLYLSYSGSLLSKGAVGFENGVGQAKLFFQLVSDCNKVGDTIKLFFTVKDNQCPFPLVDTGVVNIVVLPPFSAPSTDLNCLKYMGDNKLALSWDSNTVSHFASKFTLVRKDKGGMPRAVGTFDAKYPNSIEQLANQPFENEYCFALVSHDACDIASDTGSYSCTPWDDSLYPAGVYPHYVTVVDNKHIEIAWALPKQSQGDLYRVNMHNQERTLLFQSSTDTVWVDQKDIDVNKSSYCYIIETVNDCGLKAKHSPPACTILLKGKTVPFEHTLDWNEYSYFQSGTENYNILHKDLTQNQFTVKANTPFMEITYLDEKLNKETGIFYYQVVAKDSAGFYQSASNQIELRQKPLLYVPNAYTPNSDGINENWNIVPVFVNEYHLRLYDRWGKLVYETTDKHNQVKSVDMNGELLTSDVFVYVITYTGFSGEVFTRKGNLTILR